MCVDLVVKNAHARARGWMTRSIIRGKVAIEDDQVLSKEGSGRFVSRLDA